MALLSKTGTITAKTTTGNQAYTGIGFQPKVVIFFATLGTVAGYTTTQEALAFGFAVSSSQRACESLAVTSATGGGSSQRTQKQLAIALIKSGATGAFAYQADLVTMDSDGFTLNFTVADGTANIINYLALGGPDLTNAFIGSAQATATASQAFTGVGFKPDCVFFIGVDNTVFPTVTTSNNGQMLIGAGVSSSARGVLATRDNNSATPNTLDSTYQRSAKVISSFATASDTLDWEGDLTSLDSDGFTIAWSTQELNAQLIYLCLKGGKYNVLVDTQKTSTGTQAKTGAGFKPKALFTFGGNLASSTAIGHGSVSIGATDGTTDTGIWGGAVNAVTTSNASSSQHAKVLRHSTPASTTNAEASISTLDADGYTLNWTTADATAREFIAVVFGDAPAKASPFLVKGQSVMRASTR